LFKAPYNWQFIKQRLHLQLKFDPAYEKFEDNKGVIRRSKSKIPKG
jgi:hypothetical protein